MTIRRAKFASILCVGGLMFGVVSNAMLFQTGGAPVPASTETTQSPSAAKTVAPPARPDAPGNVAPAAPILGAAVDPTPTGTVDPPASVRPKPRTRPTASKPANRHEDAISAYLRATPLGAPAPAR